MRLLEKRSNRETQRGSSRFWHAALFNLARDGSTLLWPKNAAYKYYGEIGITICDEWLTDFMVFHNWAMANGYRDDLTIERKDVNGNYCPENCTFATMEEQSHNKRIQKNNSTGVSGISSVNGKWMARIHHRRKGYYLGIFETLEEAVSARKKAEIDYWQSRHKKIKEDTP